MLSNEPKKQHARLKCTKERLKSSDKHHNISVQHPSWLRLSQVKVATKIYKPVLASSKKKRMHFLIILKKAVIRIR